MNKLKILSMALALTALGSTPAYSDTKLLTSTPSSDAQLARAPGTLTLYFTRQVTLSDLKLVSEGRVTPVTLNRNARASSAIAVILPTIKPATYEVQWSAIAQDDGQLIRGGFSFTVLAPTDQQPKIR